MTARRLAERLLAALAAPDRDVLAQAAAIATRLDRPLYLVGGPVRDCLLGRPIVDLDLAVEGDAIGLARAVAREIGGAIKTHPRFGTAKLTGRDRSRSIDLAMTRTETYAQPAALPDVTPGTIRDDMSRRDFTINAMAIRLDGEHFGELVDPFHGESDLSHGLIRVLHDRSFRDDPTRLLRAARLEQRFNFTLAADTLALIPAALLVLDQVSGDRLRHEFELIFREARPDKVLSRLDEWGVLRQIDPELGVDARLREKFQGQSPPFDPFTCWVWLLQAASPAGLKRTAQRLNLARDDTIDLEQVSKLREAQTTIANAPSPSALYRQLQHYHDRALGAALTVVADARARAKIEHFRRDLRDVRLSIDGQRLQALGQSQGRAIGRMLADLRDAVLDGIVIGPQQEELYARALIEKETHSRETQTPGRSRPTHHRRRT